MKKWSRGFTFGELLTVVAIISLLSLGALMTFRGSAARARDLKRYKDLETIEAALYQYYTVNGSFPTTNGAWWTICNNGVVPTSYHIDWIPGLAPDYIPSLPNDPEGCRNKQGSYDGYIYKSNGTDFKIGSDRMAEIGEMCDNPSDKFYDAQRGGNGNSLCSIATTIPDPKTVGYFCSIYSAPVSDPPVDIQDAICW